MADRLEPLPEAAFIARNLRAMARELILQAEALEATLPQRKKRNVEFLFTSERMNAEKHANKKTERREKIKPWWDGL